MIYRSVEFKTQHSSCKVIFNNFCMPSVVLLHDEGAACKKPYEMRVI